MTIERRGRLVVLCGLPGSGKSTLAQSLEEPMAAVRLSPDDWMSALGIRIHDEEFRARVERLQLATMERLLVLQNTVIYESGGWTKRERDDLLGRARSLGALVELRFLDVPIEELWRRIDVRNSNSLDSAQITSDELTLWASWFERPAADELARYDPAI